MKRLGIRVSSGGFTLIELLVVIVIISILTALLMANFVGIRQRGRDAQRKADLRQVQSALEFYRSDLGYYPTLSQFGNCGLPLVDGSTIYLEKIPCEPLSSTVMPYTYVPSPSSCNNTTIICTKYSIKGCLENPNDADRDTSNIEPRCLPSSNSPFNGSFTLTNP